MRKTFQLILLIAIFAGCKSTSPVWTGASETEKSYFPVYDEKTVKHHTDSLGNRMIGMPPIKPNDSLSEFVNNWYSKHLYSLGEPVLYNKTNTPVNVVRFTHLGTWGNPYSYRLEQNKSEITATYSKTDGLGGYQAGKRIEQGSKKMNLEKWNAVIEKMNSIDFWNIGTHDENIILDGEEWIFEALIDGRYHLITRNSPDHYDGKDFAELCDLMVHVYNE